MIRSRLADLLHPDDGLCADCRDTRGSTWVRNWRMTIKRPWTFLIPEVTRLCYECWIDRDIGRTGE